MPSNSPAGPGVLPDTTTGLIAATRDLQVTFHRRGRTVRALRGVSLDLNAGEILALVGESGSGKSVLSLSLLGLLPRAGTKVAGALSVAGIDMLHANHRTLREARRHLLGAVFQDPLTSLNPSTLIIRQLTERGIPVGKALENLRDAGIPDADRRARQFPHQLSGGLRQRVMIGMALGADGAMPTSPRTTAGAVPKGAPKLIIADEPTTALDVSVQAQILALFDRLRSEHGCAIMLVTHDIGVASAVADRVAVMFAGNLCEVGPTEQVIESPQHPYTRMLLQSRLTLAGTRSPAKLTVVHAGAPAETGCAYAPRCARASDECRASSIHLQPVDGGEKGWQVACLHPLPRPALPVPETGSPGAAQAPEPDLGTPGTVTDGAGPGAGPAGMALDLQHVRKTFQVRAARGESALLIAVDDCSLRVPPGGSVALVGESGSGKTTTLRIAGGLTRPDAGTVRWDDAAGRPQLIFQDATSSLTPWLTVDRHLDERLRLRGVPRADRPQRVRELRETVGLDEQAGHSRPRQLSGGQAQRAVIARALASSPSLLICDEPVSALDASLTGRILQLLSDLRRDLGVALLTVTHDLAVAQHIADEIYVMYRGRVLEIGQTETIFSQPRHPYTQGLLAAAAGPAAGQAGPGLRGEPPSLLDRYSGCPFASRCPYTQPKCKVERPELRVLPSGSAVACHFATDQGVRAEENDTQGTNA